MARPSRLSHWKYGIAVAVTGSAVNPSLRDVEYGQALLS
jgi:hypothetical protein